MSNTDTGAGSSSGTDIIAEIYDSRGTLVKSEFRLNQASSASDERDFDMAALPGGGFVVVYVDDNGSNDTDIRLDSWNAAGTMVSIELIAADDTDSQTYRNPNVEVASDTSVLVTFENVNPDSNATTEDVWVESRIYDSTTNSVGAGVNNIFSSGVGPGQGVSGSNIAALSNGTYAVVFGDNNNAPTNDNITVQRLNADGSNLSFPIPVSAGGDYQQDPHIVGLPGGGFVVVWELDGTDNSGNSGIRASVFNNSGSNLTGIFSPATTGAGNQSNPVVTALADGGFVIAWIDEDTSDIHGQRYAANGTAVGDEFNIVTDLGTFGILAQDLDIEGLDDGRFVVTWEEARATGGILGADFDIRAKVFDPRDTGNDPDVYTTGQVIGTNGSDTINIAPGNGQVYGWTGDDRFIFDSSNDITFGDEFDGGIGFDTIKLQRFFGTTTFDFRNTEIKSIEEVEFFPWGNTTKAVVFDANQVGGGSLSSFLHVSGDASVNSENTLRFIMDTDISLSLAGFTFQNWNNADDTVHIVGDGDNETIVGSSQRDFIDARGGDDFIDGSEDADSMFGGAGNDQYSVDNIGDMVFENTGEGIADYIFSTVSYTAAANTERLYLEGADDINAMGRAGQNDILIGNSGNNILDGMGGADVMRGGLGNDFYRVDNVGDVVDEVTGGGGTADVIYSTVSYTAAANTEQLYLQGAGNINATGRNGQADILVGNSGNNVLDGKSGIDTMYGGAGNDRFHVDNVGDVVVESAGGGTVDFVYSTVSLTTIANTERLYLEGTGNINATGRDGISDIMIGNSGNNIFDGKSGVDYMYGGAGNDFYYVDSSFDAVVENAGEGSADYIFSTVSHINAANVERLYLQGTGNINATGQNGQNDILTGNSGNNVIDGKGGADFMRGGLGNDFYHVDDAGDTVDEVNGGGGTADIVAASISYAMGDGIERLYLTSTGPGLTFGVGRNDQDDVLVGGAGSNALLGNLGNDLMIGGGGVDYFRFNTALDGVNNVDRIYDFNSADDQFQLEDAIFTGMSAGILSASAFEQGTVANDASDRIIYDSASGAIFYDSDGNGAAAQTQFATVNAGTVLDESDFQIY